MESALALSLESGVAFVPVCVTGGEVRSKTWERISEQSGSVRNLFFLWGLFEGSTRAMGGGGSFVSAKHLPLSNVRPEPEGLEVGQDSDQALPFSSS